MSHKENMDISFYKFNGNVRKDHIGIKGLIFLFVTLALKEWGKEKEVKKEKGLIGKKHAYQP